MRLDPWKAPNYHEYNQDDNDALRACDGVLEYQTVQDLNHHRVSEEEPSQEGAQMEGNHRTRQPPEAGNTWEHLPSHKA